MTRRARLTLAAIVAVILVAAASGLLWRKHKSVPIYHDKFAASMADEWRPLGGAWQLSGDSVIDRSDEHGAKLLTGSSRWTDYELSGDVKLLGHDGDVGLIIRSSSEERGVDAYNGYYVGLRSSDPSLIVGRADHGWIEATPVPFKGGIHGGNWYHLQVIAVGCTIAAAATDQLTGQRAYIAAHEQSCATHGEIGLRSMGPGGAWKNITVQPVQSADYDAILQHAGAIEPLVYPTREADFNRMRKRYQGAGIVPDSSDVAPLDDTLTHPAPSPQVHPIASLPFISESIGQITMRGVVTFTDPVYVQDQSGGIRVDVDHAMLNIGDEVEFQGRPLKDADPSRFEASTFRVLWERNPITPVSITSTQAATGAFEASAVDVRGILVSKHLQPDGVIALELRDAAQSFGAIMRGGLAAQAFRSWQPGSELRLRGICTMDPPIHATDAQSAEDAFSILLRSVDDVEVIQDPPFWNGQRIVQAVLAAVALTVALAFLYLRFERTKARAVLAERERLAHDMHDTLAQSFAGVGFQLQGVRNSFERGKSDIAGVMRKIDVACELVTASHREASATIAALHPDADGDLDLLVALDRCIRTMVEDDSLPIAMERQGTVRPMSLSTRDLLFHIGREAMTNVLRHSGATSASLLLCYEPNAVSLSIRDNGAGFDTVAKAQGFGIRTMHRRCEKLGATLEVSSQRQHGSVITVRASDGAGTGIWERTCAIARGLFHRSARIRTQL